MHATIIAHCLGARCSAGGLGRAFCFPHTCSPMLWEQRFWPCHLPVLACSLLSLKFRLQVSGLWVQELWTLPRGPAALAPQKVCHPEARPIRSAEANHRHSFTMSLVLLLCGCYECIAVGFGGQRPLSALLKEPVQDSQKRAFAGEKRVQGLYTYSHFYEKESQAPQ